MALSEVYVDPSIAANSGTGTSGDPYGDLQYALDNTTLGANGTRINIKAGTAEVLTKALDLTTGFTGTPSAGARLVFQGYTSTANDGGQCELDCTTNSVQLMSAGTSNVTFQDIYAHSDTTSSFVVGGFTIFIVRCDFRAGGTIVDVTHAAIHDSYILGAQTVSGAVLKNAELVHGSTIKCGTAPTGGYLCFACEQLINSVFDMSATSSSSMSGVTNGGNTRDPARIGCTIIGNGYGAGIDGLAIGVFLANNYIENCATGISDSNDGVIAVGNRFYNCGTNVSLTGEGCIEIGSTNLGSSGLSSGYVPGSDLIRTGLPSTLRVDGTTTNLSVGAIQPSAGGGGGNTYSRGRVVNA